MSKFDDEIKSSKIAVVRGKNFVVIMKNKKGKEIYSGIDKLGAPIKIGKKTVVYAPSSDKTYTGNDIKEIEKKIKDKTPDSFASGKKKVGK
jgi:hypothetical protein